MPKETIIYYSKKHFISMFLCSIAFIVFVGIVFGDIFPVILFSCFLLIIIVFESNKLINHVFKKEPQIVLNKNGIETVLTPFTKWENVLDEDVFKKKTWKYGKSFGTYLTFIRKNGINYEYEELEISEYDVDIEELKNLLKYYKNS